MTFDFSGRIISADGEVIYQRVSGTIYVWPDKSWEGELTIESGEPPSMFKGFVVTDEGGKAELFATDIIPVSNTITIEFSGTGPPPFDYP